MRVREGCWRFGRQRGTARTPVPGPCARRGRRTSVGPGVGGAPGAPTCAGSRPLRAALPALAALGVVLLGLSGCAGPGGAGAGPVPVTRGPETHAPRHAYPTSMTFPDAYARTWDGAVAVLASRGFPMDTLSRDSGVITTGWRVTQPNHRVPYGDRTFVGRKVERLTLLVRPVAGGTAVSATSQTALVSPQWSAAGPAPAGQVLDLETDTVTEYGLLHDMARVLGHRPEQAPDPAYGKGLAETGVFDSSPVRLGGQEVRP